ncbi:MAG: hypothetical protein E7328_00260 [Clostridiales bacterium]|nr:hypothetical protein [Clostridiales bacterium]
MADAYILDYSRFTGIDQSMTELDTPLHATHDAQNIAVRGGVLMTAPNDEVIYDLGVGSIESLIERVCLDEDGRPMTELYAATKNAIHWLSPEGIWEEVPIIEGQTSGKFDYVNYSVGDTYYTILANGEQQMGVWKGLAMAETFGEETVFGSLCLHYERIWGTGNPNYHQRVWYSDAYEAEDWFGAGSGSVDVYSPTTSKTVAIRSLYNEIVIFKDREIFRVYGTYPSEFGVSKVAGDFGPVNCFSIVSAMDQVYYMSPGDGICYYDGMRTRPLGDEKLRSFFENPSLNLENCCGVSTGRKIYFALCEDGDGINDAILEYDVVLKSYMVYRGINANCFLKRGGEILYGSSDGKIYRMGTDRTGAKKYAYWRTPTHDLGAKYTHKTSTVLYAHVKGEGELSISADFGTRIREKRIVLTEELTPVRIPIHALGRTVSYRFCNVDGSTFEIHGPQVAIEIDED